MRTIDLGSMLSLTGAAILTTYVAGSAETTGAANRVRATAKITTIGGTAITSIQAKLQASSDGSTWHDVESQGDGDGSAAPAVEHSLTISAGTTQELSMMVEGPYDYLRIAAKATGGVGQVGETLSASGDAAL